MPCPNARCFGPSSRRLLAERHDAPLKAGRDNALVGEARFGSGAEVERVVLAFPITYMNESGQAVAALVRRYKIDEPGKIIVVHDELDLDPGVLRLKAGGGLAGHNGLRSITQHLKTQDFLRVRIGVGKPPSKDRGADHVLDRVPAAQRELLDSVVAEAADAVETIVAEGIDAAMRQFHVALTSTHRSREATAPLRALPGLLRDEPGADRALGEPNARLAIPEVARPISIAALARTVAAARPLVVACPTGAMAGQLYDDLQQFLGRDQVALVPGVGDAAVRAHQPQRRDDGATARAAVAARATPERCPTVIVSGVRALLQKLGPGATRRRADRGPPGRRSSIPTGSSEQLVEFGYRREELVEHRGEFARRGAIVDVFPSTADAPIRIDLWGDEVDRLTTFGVNDQRSRRRPRPRR